MYPTPGKRNYTCHTETNLSPLCLYAVDWHANKSLRSCQMRLGRGYMWFSCFRKVFGCARWRRGPLTRPCQGSTSCRRYTSASCQQCALNASERVNKYFYNIILSHDTFLQVNLFGEGKDKCLPCNLGTPLTKRRWCRSSDLSLIAKEFNEWMNLLLK